MTIAQFGQREQATSARMNQIVDAVNDNTARTNAQKELGYNEITAASSSFTSIADVSGLSISVVLAAPRTVRVEVYGLVQSDTNADRLQLTLADGSNTVLGVTGDLLIPAANASVFGHIIYRAALAAGAYTFKVRAQRLAGSGTCIVNAATTRRAFIEALDVT